MKNNSLLFKLQKIECVPGRWIDIEQRTSSYQESNKLSILIISVIKYQEGKNNFYLKFTGLDSKGRLKVISKIKEHQISQCDRDGFILK